MVSDCAKTYPADPRRKVKETGEVDSDGEMVKLEDVEKEGDGGLGDEGSVGAREASPKLKRGSATKAAKKLKEEDGESAGEEPETKPKPKRARAKKATVEVKVENKENEGEYAPSEGEGMDVDEPEEKPKKAGRGKKA